MAQTEKQTTPQTAAVVTPAQLREAERGLRMILAAKFKPVWIAQNVREVLAEANVDYVRFVREHGPARNPTGWLIERGRLRALNLVNSEIRHAGPPLDSVIHSIEDHRPTPEESLLEDDREQAIAAALAALPPKERRLIALVYYERRSIRAAGRLLGWGSSTADYHHKQAMAKLRAALPPRDFLGRFPLPIPLVGILAQELARRDDGPLPGGIRNRLSAAAEDLADNAVRAVDGASRHAGEAARRVTPIADRGAALPGSGAARLAAQCGAVATAALCSALVVFSPPIERAVDPHHHRQNVPAEAHHVGEPAAQEPETNAAPTITPGTSRSSAAARYDEGRRIERRRRHRIRRRHARARAERERRARKARTRATAIKERRNENIETPEVVEPAPSEPAPEIASPESESSPPPATAAQTNGEFGL